MTLYHVMHVDHKHTLTGFKIVGIYNKEEDYSHYPGQLFKCKKIGDGRYEIEERIKHADEKP